MKFFSTNDLENMRALLRQGAPFRSIKAFFRDEGFDDDDTMALFWSGPTNPDLVAVVYEANRIRLCRAAGICAKLIPIRRAEPVYVPHF